MKQSLQYRLAAVPKARFVWGVAQFTIGNTGLHETGWFKSIWVGSAVNKKGEPIPWITYPCIYLLEDRLPKTARVFEYGSGSSTLWWSSHCKSVISIEYDRTWYEKVKKKLPENAQIKYYDLDNGYVEAISEEKGEFDVVMVDGRKRSECAKECLKRLSKKGVIVWDNTNRERYQEGIKYLRKQGFRQADFYGQGPLSPKNSLTTIFYRDNNILSL